MQRHSLMPDHNRGGRGHGIEQGPTQIWNRLRPEVNSTPIDVVRLRVNDVFLPVDADVVPKLWDEG